MPARIEPRGPCLAHALTSVPIPKFASPCGTSDANFRSTALAAIGPAAPEISSLLPPSCMPKITYIDHEGTTRTVDGEVGSTVMETAIKNGIPGIEAECGGACACATCHVHVEEAWRPTVGEPSPMEEDMLDFGYDVK